MHKCEDCGEMCANLAHHRSEFHSVPRAMLVNGVWTDFQRDGDDSALECPVSGCNNRHKRRSNFVRHLKNDHGLNATTPQSNGKRSLSSSVESLAESTRKKTKIVVDKVGKVLKRESLSIFCICNLHAEEHGQNSNRHL